MRGTNPLSIDSIASRYTSSAAAARSEIAAAEMTVSQSCPNRMSLDGQASDSSAEERRRSASISDAVSCRRYELRTVATEPGAGPRHFALHPSGSFAFVIHELGNSMTPYRLDADGALTPGTTVSTLPGDFNGQNSGAHVEVSPDGRFLYGSNRGHDSIVVFSIGEDGGLTLVEHEPTRGRTPRDFEMDPAGDIVIGCD